MAIPFKLKRSSVPGKIPDSSDLAYGELALNYADGKLYYKNSNNNVRSFLDSGQIINLIDSAYVQARRGPITISSATPPSSPGAGELWFDENDGTLSVYYNDGTSSQWVVISGPAGPDGLDSAAVQGVIFSTVDSSYVQARQLDGTGKAIAMAIVFG